MRRACSFAALLLGLCAFLPATAAGPVAAAPPPEERTVTVEILAAGAVVAEHVATEPALATSTGVVSEVPLLWTPDFLPGGTEIRAHVGLSMGIEVVVKGPPFLTVVDLRTRVTHPPMTNPRTGLTSDREEWDSPMNAGYPRYAGWSFDNPWELVPGTWKIEILQGQRPLATQEFVVVVDAESTR